MATKTPIYNASGVITGYTYSDKAKTVTNNGFAAGTTSKTTPQKTAIPAAGTVVADTTKRQDNVSKILPPQAQSAQGVVNTNNTNQNTATNTSNVSTDIVLTDKQMAEGLYNTQLTNDKDYAKELGLDTSTMASSIEEVIKMKQDANKKNLEEQQRQNDYAQKQDEAALAQVTASGESSKSAMVNTLAQGREGVMGFSAPIATQEYISSVNKNIGQAQSALDNANTNRINIMDQLREANANGDAELAKSLSKNLASIEDQIITNRTKLLDAQSQASDTALKMMDAQNKNLTQFTGLIQSGATLTQEGLSGLAQQLNIPTDVAFSYYNGMQTIRSDKSLDVDKKAIETMKLQSELDRTMRGITNTELEKVDYIQNLYKSGASTEEIAQVKKIMGVKDEDDAMYMADLRIKNAESLIKELEAKNFGQPPAYGTKDYFDYKKAELEYEQAKFDGQQYGDTSGNVPLSTGEYKDIFYQNGKSDYGHGEGKRECGEAYNDITDGVNVGDSYSSKIAIVNKSEDKLNNVQIGNGLIIPLGGKKYGHIETVVNVSDENGRKKITTESWNRDKKGGQTTQTYYLDELNDKFGKYGSDWGFSDSKLMPEYEEKIKSKTISKTPTTKEKTDAQIEAMNSLDQSKLTAEDKKTLANLGLTEIDLFEHKANTNKPLSSTEKQNYQDLLDKVKWLNDPAQDDDRTSVTGTSSYYRGWMSGSSENDYVKEFNSFKDAQLIPLLANLKGATSDKDIAFLKSAASSLNLGMTEERFKEILDTTQKVLENKLGGTNNSADAIIEKYSNPTNDLANKWGLN